MRQLHATHLPSKSCCKQWKWAWKLKHSRVQGQPVPWQLHSASFSFVTMTTVRIPTDQTMCVSVIFLLWPPNLLSFLKFIFHFLAWPSPLLLFIFWWRANIQNVKQLSLSFKFISVGTLFHLCCSLFSSLNLHTDTFDWITYKGTKCSAMHSALSSRNNCNLMKFIAQFLVPFLISFGPHCLTNALF